MTAARLDIAFVVLHTSPLDEPGTKDAGGMNVVVMSQATELARAGHRVRLFTRRSHEEQPAVQDLAPRLTVHHLDAGPARLLAKGDHEAFISTFGEALRGRIAEHRPDILHAQHWYSGVAALQPARTFGIPLVQSYHSIAAPEGTPLAAGERPEASGRLASERRLAHDAQLVVAVSEAERRTVIERLGGDEDRVRVVPPGVDTACFHPRLVGPAGEAGVVGAQAARREVLVAGRLDPLKRFDLAIAAVAAIPSPERPLLRIVGAAPPDGSDYERRLHRAVDAAGMRATTIFEGALPRPQLAERMRNADLVLIPSHSETFGLVALEAAASGVPVIAAAAGGLREAVLHGETGLLIENDAPESWASAIRRILGDQALRARMGSAGRTRAEAHSWQRSAEQLAQAYHELLG